MLDPTDPLIDVGDHGVPIAVDPVRIAFALAGGSLFPLEGSEVAKLRRAGELWLGLGLLTWIDTTHGTRTAPLALWPVVLDAEEPALRACPVRSPRLNDALVLALQQHGIALPPIDDLAALLEAARAAAVERAGWCLERVARLAAFSFARFELARDAEHLQITNTPAAWLAGAGAPPALPVAHGEILAPLEADTSQLAAIAAAGAGGSFVLHAAPGTGATQTIANLVVHCAAAGKSVLVVGDRNDKTAQIKQRLAEAGLPDVCMPLAGDVRDFLVKALDRAFRPGSGPRGTDERLAQLRGELDAHAAAMHAVGPFGASVHAVLGRLIELRTTPCASLAEPDAIGLDKATFEARRAAVISLATAAQAVEPVASHPWRQSALSVWRDGDAGRASRALAEAKAAVDALGLALVELPVPGIVTKTPEQLRALGTLAQLASVSPRPGAELLTNLRTSRADEVGEQIALIRAKGSGILDVPRDPASFLALASRHRVLAAEVAETFTEPDGLDAGELWSQLKRWSTSSFRFMALRSARAMVKAASGGSLETDDAMLVALEAVIAERAAREALLGAAEPAKRWFGAMAGDVLALDLAAIENAAAWGTELRRAFEALTIAGGDTGRQAAWRTLVALVSAQADADSGELAPFARAAAAVDRWQPALAELAAATGIALAELGAGTDHLNALRDQLAVLIAAEASLADWARFHLARHASKVAGVGAAIATIERGDLAAAHLADAWERATLLAWLDAELRATPALAKFAGTRHHSAVSQFADLDRSSLVRARAKIVARLAERLPRGAADDEIATLRAPEPRPLRDLLAAIPTLLPRLAPCVLATPHEVAAQLDPMLSWDLVVFEDATQIRVAHAVGALARARAAVIVGDARRCGVEDDLLSAALAARFPELSLRVHYRSRHEDLFAFANRRLYGDRIEVLPAAFAPAEVGVRWKHIAGEPDATGANRAEAEAVIADALARRRGAPHRSLAIVAMSRAHADLIEQLLPAELAGTLVGTPDRVQGESRDVALVTFGDLPPAVPGTERWLAAATTCAREELVLFTSFDDAHGLVGELVAYARVPRIVDASEPASPVTAAIARSLADRGWSVRHQIGAGQFRIDLAVVDPDDPTRYVLAVEHDGKAYASGGGARDRDRLRAQQLAALGWRLHRVWTLDWWLDPEREIQRAHGAIVAAIAASRQRRTAASSSAPARMPARTPRATGSAPLGASAVAASPRAASPLAAAPESAPTESTAPVSYTADTARVASADQTAKVADQAQAASDKPAADSARVPLAIGSGPIDALLANSSPVRIPRGAIAIGPYAAAAIPPGRRAPDDMFAPRYLTELGKCVEQVLAAEAPIHIELLARRVAAYFGIGKVSPRVVEQVQNAVLGRGKWGDEKGIVWRIDQDPTAVPGVRVAGANAQARRAIAEVPLSELASAARIVVERQTGVAASDLVRDAARLLGFTRLTPEVSERVALGIRLATARQLIAVDNGKATLLV